MSQVIDLVALAINEFEQANPSVKVFAWFDYSTEKWRGIRRNRSFKYPAYTKPWTMNWDIVAGERYQFATEPRSQAMLASYPSAPAA